jgi:O-antigen/teichoic acid export membrane protein
VAAAVVRLPKREGPPFPSPRLLSYFGQMGAYTLLLNLLLWVGLFLLKRYTEGRGELAGYYGAAQTLAVLSYQAIIAIIFVIFPLVSRATFEGQVEAARAYVRKAMRYALVLAGAFAAVLCALPGPVLRVPYPREFGVGAGALRALALGFVAFDVLAVAGAILNGAGRTGAAIISVGVTLVVALVGNVFLLPGAADPLGMAARVTAASMVIGLLASGILLKRTFGVGLPPATLARVALALGAGMAAGAILPVGGRILTLLECGVVEVLFVGILLLTRELTRGELAGFRAILGKGRS